MQFASATASAAEADGTVDLAVTLGPTASGKTVTVDWATSNGSASAAGGDYTAGSGTLTFAPGEVTQTITLAIGDDTLDEVVEDLHVTLHDPNANTTLGAPSQATVTITDDDAPPLLSVDDVRIVEGDTGATQAAFTLSLSSPSGKSIDVDQSIGGGTATPAVDYVGVAPGTVTFDVGETLKTVTATVTGDLDDEIDETFLLTLSNEQSVSLDRTTATATIEDDDGADIAVSDVTVSEGDAGTVTASFSVTLSRTTGQDVTVAWATADGTATAPADYAAASGSLSVPAGAVTRTIEVQVAGDLADELDETLAVHLSDPTGGELVDPIGIGTIVDDDDPTLSIADGSALEGDAGPVTADFTLSLSHTSPRDVYVHWATGDGDATAADGDYTAASGDVTIPAGSLTATVSIDILGDTVDEVDELFAVTLSAADGAVLDRAVANGAVFDDDGPDISVADASVTEGDSGTKVVSFPVTLSAVSPQDVSMHWATTDGSAHAPADYTAAAGTLFIADGSTVGFVTATVKGDAVDEPDETFHLVLSAPVHASIDRGTATATIVDDDATPGPTTTTSTTTPGPTTTTTTTPPTAEVVVRVSGIDRIATSVAVSAGDFDDGSAAAVVLARSDDFADALSAAPLAAAVDGPLLLTGSSGLDTRVRDEIVRILPAGGTVYVLGGQQAVREGTAQVLRGLGFTVVRIAGTDRYDTAVRVAHQLGDPDVVFLATGTNFADGLCGGAAAGSVGAAVLLTNGNTMPPATATYLAAHPPTGLYALGGPAATAAPTAVRIAGPDRYATCARVAAAFAPDTTVVGVASGAQFPDGLSGGASLGAIGAPLLLADGALAPEVQAFLNGHRADIDGALVYGGSRVVSNGLLAAVQSAIAD